jgi:uncharacterized protein with GYD domain
MPTYIMLTTLTSEGAHTGDANPDRLTAVADEVAKSAARLSPGRGLAVRSGLTATCGR